MSKLLFLAVVGLAISSVAQSPPPAPSPTKIVEKKQQLSRSETNSGNPSQQAITRTVRNNKHAKTQSNKNSQKSSTDWWIVTFTGILTVVGALQYWAMRQQAGYMRDGLAETKVAADAAKTSANAAEASVVSRGKTCISINARG
jgi:hypothetical protein